MSGQQILGLALIAALIFAALFAAAWLRGRQERARAAGQEPARTWSGEPEPGSFTAAVLNAERAAHHYREQVLTGGSQDVDAAVWRIMQTGAELVVALEEREEAARARLYAAGPGSVTVSESDRLAGEPTHSPGDTNDTIEAEQQQQGRGRPDR